MELRARVHCVLPRTCVRGMKLPGGNSLTEYFLNHQDLQGGEYCAHPTSAPRPPHQEGFCVVLGSEEGKERRDVLPRSSCPRPRPRPVMKSRSSRTGLPGLVGEQVVPA